MYGSIILLSSWHLQTTWTLNQCQTWLWLCLRPCKAGAAPAVQPNSPMQHQTLVWCLILLGGIRCSGGNEDEDEHVVLFMFKACYRQYLMNPYYSWVKYHKWLFSSAALIISVLQVVGYSAFTPVLIPVALSCSLADLAMKETLKKHFHLEEN